MSNVQSVLSHRLKGDLSAKYSFVKTAQQVLGEVYPPMEWLVDSVLPRGGTAVLGGPPKIGKSYFLLDLIGKITKQGHCVYYFAGEDNGRRMQTRMNNLGINDENLLLHMGRDNPINSNTYFQTLREMTDDLPEVKAIFLDTMSLVLPRLPKERSYDDWVNDLKPYNELAMRKNVTLLMVHHTRKTKAGAESEGWDDFLGSQGITASFDTLLKMTRATGESNQVKFKVGGKDVEEQELRLEKKEYGYEMVGLEVEASLGDAQSEVFNYIKAHSGCTQSEMLDKRLARGNKGNLSEICRKLKAMNLVEQIGNQYYAMK
jgi:hypothetical protein